LYNTSELRQQFLELLDVYWKVEGDVLQSLDQKFELWMSVLAAECVPPAERTILIVKFRVEIARATRPKWAGRLERGGELATLSAPSFLKRVHAEDIAPDGTVRNEIIRAIDADLMKAIEVYISQRRGKKDLGDAEGLKFVLARPSSGRTAQKGHAPK